MEESGVDSLPYLQYTNFLSLSDKESVIVRTIIPVYVSGKGRERSKQRQSSQDPFAYWAFDAALIG